jgi:hypothetical protein
VSDDDPILEAMAAELRRSRQGLRVPGSPRPYYMSYVLRRRRELLLEAAYGSLLRRRDREQGSLHVDGRVGSHEFDNVIDGGLGGDDMQRESADWLTAPDDLDPIALRYALWKLTQIKFDEALEDYYDHRKAMVAEYLRDEVASFTREAPARHLEPIESFDRAEQLPIERWSAELVELSRRLLEHPDIHDPGLSIHGERVHRWFVDSDGSMVRSADLWLEFEVRGWVLTDDGVYVEASRSWPARSVAEMLDANAMAVLFDEVVSSPSCATPIAQARTSVPRCCWAKPPARCFTRRSGIASKATGWSRAARRERSPTSWVSAFSRPASTCATIRPSQRWPAARCGAAIGSTTKVCRPAARSWCATGCWSDSCATGPRCPCRPSSPSSSPSAPMATAARLGSSAAWRGWAT